MIIGQMVKWLLVIGPMVKWSGWSLVIWSWSFGQSAWRDGQQ